MGSNREDTGEQGDRTDVPYDANINHPTNMDKLPDELKQRVEAKFNIILKAFLQSCTKDQRDKVTQFKEPDLANSSLLRQPCLLHLR